MEATFMQYISCKEKCFMKSNLVKFTSLLAALFISVNANATLLFTYQGSSTTTAGVPMTPAEARAAWEAELASFGIDTLTGPSGGAPFTSAFGNTYSETGNGSVITSTGNSIRGDRNGASLIQFDVDFQKPVNAVGFDVIDNDGGGMSLSLTNATTGVVTTYNFQSVSGSGRTEFFGVIFAPTVFISSLRVGGTDPGGITTWDNFTTGVGRTAVNEPATLAMFGLMLAGVASMRKRAK